MRPRYRDVTSSILFVFLYFNSLNFRAEIDRLAVGAPGN